RSYGDWSSDVCSSDLIPDPQAAATFEASRLRWDERSLMPHAGVLQLYRTLLRLRREIHGRRNSSLIDIAALDDHTIAIVRGAHRSEERRVGKAGGGEV